MTNAFNPYVSRDHTELNLVRLYLNLHNVENTFVEHVQNNHKNEIRGNNSACNWTVYLWFLTEGTLDENWLLDFATEKHLKYLCDVDTKRRLPLILQRSANGEIKGNKVKFHSILCQIFEPKN